LENSFLIGSDEYPKTLNAAYSLLLNWKPEQETAMISGGGDLAFANVGEDNGDDGGADADGTMLVTKGS
jgi:hypothetical protein